MNTTTTLNPSIQVSADPRVEEPFGILAEFEDINTLMAAAEKVRDAGYKKWEAYTPFPVHGLDTAMGHEPTKLPWIVLAGGLTGMMTGLFLVWWTNATSFEGLPYVIRGYQFHISGKPYFSLPANIPPIFELTILFSAFCAFFGMLVLNGLPKFYHPVFTKKRFDRATQDRFFIAIESDDPRYDRPSIEKALRDAGATAIEAMEE